MIYIMILKENWDLPPEFNHGQEMAETTLSNIPPSFLPSPVSAPFSLELENEAEL